MSTTATRQKLCSKCHRDITHERRLKDAKGQYWCSDCGVPSDASATTSGLISPCPKCHAPVHATQMIRKDGIYVCAACASGVKRGKRGGSGVHPSIGAITHGAAGAVIMHHALSDEERAKRKKAFVAVGLVIASIAAYYVMNYVLFA